MAQLDFISASPMAFGNVAVGTTAQQSATAKNEEGVSSNHEDDVTSIVISGPGAAAFGLNPAGPNGSYNGLFQNYAPKDTNSGFVTFTPVALIAYSATLTITYNILNFSTGHFVALGATVALPLTGTGVSGGGGGAGGESPSLSLAFRRELVPSTGNAGIVLAYYDETTLNDANDSRQYIFRAEDIIAERVPTIRRVILTYIDLGVATVTATVNGVDDTGALVSTRTTATVGTAMASGRLMTSFIDLTATCFRPQLTLSQGANGGPLQLSTVMMTGTIEKQVTL
jgi:hypothetical protein